MFGGPSPYTLRIVKSAEKAILKSKKKDRQTYSEAFKKINRILTDPYHTGHPLHGKYSGVWETHVKNNVLVYRIDENAKIVEIVQYIDHDLL